MNNNPHTWLMIGLLFLLAACQTQPMVINHDPPSLSVSFSKFEEAACPVDENGNVNCGSGHPLGTLDCDDIQAPPGLFGGLDPAYPIAICQVDAIYGNSSDETKAEIDAGEYFYYAGGLSGIYIRYVIFRDDEFILLKSEKEFRDVYAPIESPEEALSYVLAVTNLSAYYGIAVDPASEYVVETIEDTFVTSTSDGYELLLYSYAAFGCGPHWTSAVMVHVSGEGIIQELSRTQVSRDPNLDDVCFD
ncbi:MAG TPA: hypothetical protein VMJ90_00505 [Anaerolineales bacterium]|nr:hypothetical protein [Anaerolineales bacterium]